MKTRIEHDLLGEKEVPVDAYYGIQTLRGIENFQNISGGPRHLCKSDDHSTFNFRVYYRLYPFDARSNETGSKKPDYSDSRKCQTPDVGFTGQYLEI